jgi:hypothetical protein
MAIKYYLQPNPITPDPNDQSARVLANTVHNTDTIIAKMMIRGTGCSEPDIRAVLHLFFNVVSDEVADGNNVNTPLVNFRPGISGVFASATDVFDGSRHVLKGNVSSGIMLAQKMQSAKVEKINQPVPAPALVEFMDVNSGVANSKITPNGIGAIVGEELKFNPENPDEGIFFVNGTTTKVAVIATRTEGKLMFSIPALTPGNYSLEVRKGYKNNTTIRAGVLSDILVVS